MHSVIALGQCADRKTTRQQGEQVGERLGPADERCHWHGLAPWRCPPAGCMPTWGHGSVWGHCRLLNHGPLPAWGRRNASGAACNLVLLHVGSASATAMPGRHLPAMRLHLCWPGAAGPHGCQPACVPACVVCACSWLPVKLVELALPAGAHGAGSLGAGRGMAWKGWQPASGEECGGGSVQQCWKRERPAYRRCLGSTPGMSTQGSNSRQLRPASICGSCAAEHSLRQVHLAGGRPRAGSAPRCAR